MIALAAIALLSGAELIPPAGEPRTDYVAAAKDKPQIEGRVFERGKPFLRLVGPKPLEGAADLRDHADAKRVVSSRCAALGPAQQAETKGTSPMDYSCGEDGK